MDAWCCPGCGETRWSPFGAVGDAPLACPLCAEPMLAERRAPGRGRGWAGVERRAAAAHADPPVPAPRRRTLVRPARVPRVGPAAPRRGALGRRPASRDAR